MDAFLQKHAGSVVSTLSGFDRLVFRGTLRMLAYPAGLMKYLWAVQVLLKDFGAHAEALLDYKRTMLNATADVENAIVRLAQSEARQDELNHQVTAQERARSTAEDAYKGGAAGLFEVLEEQRQLIAARDQLEEARAADAVALVDTFKALGGGW